MMYLACPYSDPSRDVREARFHLACYATTVLLQAGHAVFSSIVHSHPLVDYGLPIDWEFWERHDREYLVRCDEVVVLKLKGWEESVGVAAEIALAGDLGKPVHYVDLTSLASLSPTLAHVAKEVQS